MDRERLTQVFGIGAFAAFLLLLSTAFIETGSKLAGSLILASPLMVVAGVFLYRRQFNLTTRRSQTGQLKAHQLQGFIAALHETESRLNAADQYFEGRIRDLPSIADIAVPFNGAIKRAKDGRWKIVAAKADNVRLVDIERTHNDLNNKRAIIDGQIHAAMEIALEAWAPEIRKLVDLGLCAMPLSLEGLDEGDVNGLLHRVHGLADHALDELQQSIQFVDALYGDAQTEQAELVSARGLLQENAVLEGLSRAVGLATSVAARIQQDFDGHRRAMLQVISALDGIPRDDSFLPVHTLERVHRVCQDVLTLKSPLQFPQLDQKRGELTVAADSALREFRTHLEHADSEAAAAYTAEFGQPLRPPSDMHDFDEYATEWIRRFSALAVAIKSLKKQNSKEALFLRFEPKMERLLQQRGQLDVAMLKLKDSSILEWFAERHPQWVVEEECLVAATNHPSANSKRTKAQRLA